MASISIPIVYLPHAHEARLIYQTADASGVDLTAALASDITIASGETALIPTGIQIAIPTNHEGQVRPRSGIALKHSVTVLNAPGTIDADYRGEIKVILINHGKTPFIVKHGMRIAQLVFTPIIQAKLTPCESLDTTTRGTGGFGHTGNV